MATYEPDPIDIEVGARLRQLRRGQRRSQAELAAALGLTFQQVQKYEKGANRIGASRLFEISRVLDVPVQFFFDDMPQSGDRPIARPHGFAESAGEPFVMDFVSSTEGLTLNRAYSAITEPRLRRRILDLVRELAGTGEGDAA